MASHRFLAAALSLALAGCASFSPPPAPQTLEMRLDTDDAAIQATGLDCTASNRLGHWTFHVPGSLEVLPGLDPLKLRCQLPGERGTRTVELVTAEGSQADAVRRGGQIGATVGGGVGLVGASASLALGIPAMAPLLLIGGIVDGYAIGSAIGMVAAERSEDGPRYRSPIIVRLKRQ